MLCKTCLASIIIFLVIELKNRLYLEREISNTDSLTGLLNSRALYARLTAFVSSGNVVLQQYLNKIFLSMTEAMQKNGWNVTFSVGALQLKSGDRLEKNVITMVDTLMYKAKKMAKILCSM